MHNGVPFDLAFRLDETTRAGWAITFSIFAGGKFNWSTMQFEKQD